MDDEAKVLRPLVASVEGSASGPDGDVVAEASIKWADELSLLGWYEIAGQLNEDIFDRSRRTLVRQG